MYTSFFLLSVAIYRRIFTTSYFLVSIIRQDSLNITFGVILFYNRTCSGPLLYLSFPPHSSRFIVSLLRSFLLDGGSLLVYL